MQEPLGDPAETYDGCRVSDGDQCTDGSFGYRTPEAFEILPVQKIRCDDTTKEAMMSADCFSESWKAKDNPRTTRSGIRPMIGFGSGRLHQ